MTYAIINNKIKKKETVVEEEKIIETLKSIMIDGLSFEIDESVDFEKINLFHGEMSITSMDYVRLLVCIEEKFHIIWPEEYLFLDDITLGEIARIVADELKTCEEVMNE